MTYRERFFMFAISQSQTVIQDHIMHSIFKSFSWWVVLFLGIQIKIE